VWNGWDQSNFAENVNFTIELRMEPREHFLILSWLLTLKWHKTFSRLDLTFDEHFIY